MLPELLNDFHYLTEQLQLLEMNFWKTLDCFRKKTINMLFKYVVYKSKVCRERQKLREEIQKEEQNFLGKSEWHLY